MKTKEYGRRGDQRPVLRLALRLWHKGKTVLSLHRS